MIVEIMGLLIADKNLALSMCESYWTPPKVTTLIILNYSYNY
jgi:hypothetical protein